MTRRSVLVTGGSRGIGRAIALVFAGGGDRVAIHHRDSPDRAEQLRDELPGDGHIVVAGDAADPSAVWAFVTAAAEALGGLDVVVNNAAAAYPVHPILETSYVDWQAVWRRTLEVNLLGPANVAWCAVRHMRPGGRIINISSRGAFRGEPQQPAYGASKAGLNALTQSLALTLAPHGIAVAAVAPGYIETDMTRSDLESARGDEIRGQSPFHRAGRPEEVAAAVHYLASPAAEWASGAVLDLNGASYLR